MDIETSLMVDDYPEPPETKMKTIKGELYLAYKFVIDIPEDWELDKIYEDTYENLGDYQQDLYERVIELKN